MMNFNAIVPVVYTAINAVCKKYGYETKFPYHEREDLAGDILEKLVKIQSQYDSNRAKPEAWAYAIAWNDTISALKVRFPKSGSKGRKTRLVGIRDHVSREMANKSYDELFSQYTDEKNNSFGDSYESVAEREENYRRMCAERDRLLETLSDKEQIILLKSTEGIRSAVIAEQLGISVNDVNVTKFRALKKVKKNLYPSAFDNEDVDGFFISSSLAIGMVMLILFLNVSIRQLCVD